VVHYNDLKADLSGEMHRIADFLGIEITPDLWPALIEAAGFEAMRRAGETLMDSVATSFKNGSQRFFFKGSNERWRRVVADEDLALYDAKAGAMLSPACRDWTARGRLLAGDPRST